MGKGRKAKTQKMKNRKNQAKKNAQQEQKILCCDIAVVIFA